MKERKRRKRQAKEARAPRARRNKESRARKPPKPFKRPLKKKKYNRKLAGRIFLEPDREFLASITATNDDGRIVPSHELTKDERGRLKKLRKVAKKNKRGPRVFRLAILGLIVAAVLVFGIVFKDGLVTRGAETLLEKLFEARVDLTGVRFKPFAGEITFGSLTIADADAPMRNLLEMSTGSLQVDSWQLVQRRVIIDDLTVQGLRFGTPRDVSGALEPEPDAADLADVDEASGGGGTASAGGQTLLDRVGDALPPISFAELGLPDTLDAQQFLDDNLDALQTAVVVQALSTTATGFVDRWREELGSLTDELMNTADEVTDFARTDFTSIRSVEAAMAVYDDATSIQATVTGMSGRIESQYNALVSEAGGILDSARQLPELARSDYDNLLARIPDVRGGGRDFVVGLVTPYVQAALGDWYGRIVRVQEIYVRLTAGDEVREPRRGRREGTDFNFQAYERPRLLIRNAALGVGAEGDETLSATITALTTDPDLVDEPTAVTYAQTGRAGTLGVNAVLDGRTGAQVPMDLAVRTSQTPLAVNRGLEALSVSNVSGVMGLAVSLRSLQSGLLDGTFDVSATELAVTGSYAANSLGEFVADLLHNAGVLEGVFAFTMRDSGNVQFSQAQTNLDNLVADAVRERIDVAVAAFRVELEDRLTSYLDPMIASLTERLDGIVDVETSAEELLALARDREAAAAELQRFAQDSISSLTDQLEAEARAALEAAKAEAEARAQEVMDAAEEEARQAAAEAAAQAEEAARDAVGDAAEDAVDTIRNVLPFGNRR